MRIPKVKVIFDRKHQAPAEPGAIEIRISMNGKQHYVSTGYKVRSMNRLSPEQNARIAAIMKRINDHISNCIADGRTISMDDIRCMIVNVDDGENFIDFVCDRKDKRAIAPGTRRQYNSFVNRLEDYGKIRNFSDISVKAIMEFDEWLHSLGLKQVTIYNQHKFMKLFINDAIIHEKLTENPYGKLKGKIDRGDVSTVEYLTMDEVRMMEEHVIDIPHLARARDLFLFQCYTGLPYADLRKFDINDYQFEDGKYFKILKRTKTGIDYASQLLQPAVEILKRYKMVLPVMDLNRYNLYLKAVGPLCGIKKTLHSHMGRHTFATMMLSNGVSLPNVASMLGHTKTEQTLVYAKVLAEVVRKDFDKMDEILRNRPASQ